MRANLKYGCNCQRFPFERQHKFLMSGHKTHFYFALLPLDESTKNIQKQQKQKKNTELLRQSNRHP